MKRPWDTNKTSTRINIRPFADAPIRQRCELFRVLIVCGWIFALNGCAAGAYKVLDNMDFPALEVETSYFKHLVIQNDDKKFNGPVVVFIEGDGQPWETRYRVAFDPTPDQPLMLHWFQQSEYASLYLGRPCYYGLVDPACAPYWYTHGRYSEQVVASMADALSQSVGDRPVVLIGHSGGGTLAVLMAELLPNLLGVVTVAGNLQVASWVDYHNYSELLGSQDPESVIPQDRDIVEKHFYSANDRIILGEWVRAYSSVRANAESMILDAPDHNIGWKPYWHHISDEIRTILKGRVSCCDEKIE